jgi:cytochrome bd ubiquinol oxidase subunit II
VHLYALPLCFALVGLALYTVLAGADFGAGLWQLTAGSGPMAERIRDHTHDAMAPVWEANHVWLVFVLTVVWTAYPTAFGSIASTLSVPLFIAALGIIFRGATYALRSGAATGSETRAIDTAFAIASILTPFALGATVGGIASLRVPVGNAAGHLFSSWLNPTSILIGVLAVATGAYLAAVFLSADAVRLGDRALERQFRIRALIAGAVAGAIAIGGIAVLHGDAHRLYHGLVHGSGLAALLVSVLAGIGTVALVWARRFEPARYTAAVAVAAIIVGWALAQKPLLLRGLTIKQAAAPHDTLVLVIVAILGGGVILLPSLGLLFRLVLGGRLDHGPGVERAEVRAAAGPRAIVFAARRGLLARFAAACLIAGVGLLTIAEAPWAHALGVVALFAFVVFGFVAVGPAELAASATDGE